MAIHLGDRLAAAAALAGTGRTLMDVGCDHAHLGIFLLQTGQFERVIAMDVGAGPLAIAKENLAMTGLEGQCELRLSDGLEKAKAGEAQVLVITGMGGALMRRILERFPAKTASFEKLVLSPQSEVFLVRDYLRENGFGLTREKLVAEEGKTYCLMEAVPGAEGASPDWERIRALAGALEPEALSAPEAAVRAASLILLEDRGVLRSLELTYGPGILRTYLEAGSDEDTAALFAARLLRELSEKTGIAARLEAAGEDGGGRRTRRLQELSESIGLLQLLLFLHERITPALAGVCLEAQ